MICGEPGTVASPKGGFDLAELPSLTTTQWEDLLKRLTLYADRKVRKLRWRGLRGGPNQLLPDGHGPDSIAAEAIVSVIEGSRSCSAKTPEDLLAVLQSVVDSKISHAVEYAENRVVRGEPAQRDDAPSDEWHPRTTQAQEPSQIVADREAAAKFRSQVIKILDDEPRLIELFECLEADVTGRRELAEYLGVTEDEITNMKKRLARALSPLKPEYRKAPHAKARTIR